MNIRQLLDHYDIVPKRSLGQNFLTDPNLLGRIVAAAELAPGDAVLEVGAGPGTLTQHLAEAVGEAGRVAAVEVDGRMMPVLRRHTGHLPQVEPVEADVLALDIGALMGGAPFYVVGNLPYYITSAILRHLLENTPRPVRLVLTVQHEVAKRLAAGPGDMSLLAVSVQFYGAVQVVQRIKAGAFWPMPGVDSAVVRVDTYSRPPVPVGDEARFFRVVRAGFGQKRKQLKNALASGLALESGVVVEALQRAGIDPRRRAEKLALAQWAALAAALEDA